MSELTNLLALYPQNPKKFEKAVKKATKKKLNGTAVINSAIEEIYSYEEGLNNGTLRYAKTSKDLFSLLKLSKHLVGTEVYRIWSGGKNGKICSKVVIKGFQVKEDSILVEVQANYSSDFKEPIIRTLKLNDLNSTWFLTEEACKKAIERM